MPDYPGQTPQDMVSLAIQHLKSAYPGIDQASVSPTAGTVSSTSPFGSINLATQGMGQDQVDQMLAHEMTHRQQFANRGLWGSLKGLFQANPDQGDPTKDAYWKSPDEQQAYGVQRQWEWANRDIPLPRGGQP